MSGAPKCRSPQLNADALERVRAIVACVQLSQALDEVAATTVMDAIMAGLVPADLLTSYLTGLAERGETVDELVGSIRSLRRHMLRFDPGGDCIDVCGTGGDGLGTFNISTAVALVVAAAGVPVAKTGNRSASSKCGSADLLEALGIPIDLPPSDALQALRNANFVFLFAPQYHSAARHAGPVRKSLGRPTIFNWIGPLCNPASPSHQVIGVPGEARARRLAEALHRLGATNARVVCGAQGMDELAPGDGNRVFEIAPSGVTDSIINASDAGIPTHVIETLRGGDSATNAGIITSILHGEPGPGRDVVCLNAALALLTFKRVSSLPEGVRLAGEAIDSGWARRTLEQLRAIGPSGRRS